MGEKFRIKMTKGFEDFETEDFFVEVHAHGATCSGDDSTACGIPIVDYGGEIEVTKEPINCIACIGVISQKIPVYKKHKNGKWY